MMCQATVYLDDRVIMRDVMLVEPVSQGVRLTALFEPVQVVPAAIRQIDLMKHRIILEPLDKVIDYDERSGDTVSGKPV